MKRIEACFFKLMEVVIVFCIVLMLILVFTNVVLRAVFNSGIDWSEELPRFLFIWMTFLGAVIAMRQNAHLGIDSLVKLFPLAGKKICWAISQLLILLCCVVMFYGTWLQHEVMGNNYSPTMQVRMLWVFGVTYITSAAMTLICIANLIRLVRGQVTESELILVEEEGMHNIHSQEVGTEEDKYVAQSENAGKYPTSHMSEGRSK